MEAVSSAQQLSPSPQSLTPLSKPKVVCKRTAKKSGEPGGPGRKTFSFQGTKRGRGAARKMYLFFLAPISSRRNAGPWQAACNRMGLGHAQPPHSGYSRWLWVVEELEVLARRATVLALLLQIQ